jgi:DNA integrity scanning protein DisA with diadenylate cyclase activity
MGRRERLGVLLSSRTDQVGARGRGAAEKALDRILKSVRLQNIDRRIVTDLASLDGALIVDRSGRTLAYGAMTRTAGGSRQGARSRAAIASSREGLAIKVSSDGNISLFARGESVMEL